MRRHAMPAGQDGFSLVGLMVAVSIMLIMMSVAVPSWDYVVRNEREEELLYRGCRIAMAIAAYQQQMGGAPSSIDQLVRGKFLRKAWTDPMTKDGKWRLLRQGDLLAPGAPGRPVNGPVSATPGQSSFGTPQIGTQFIGVASLSQEKSLRVVNGATHYNEWRFVANQPVMVGKTPCRYCPMPVATVPGQAIPRPPQ